MLAIVTPDLRDEFADYLEQMFQHRKAVFVDQLGWRLKVVDDKEVDEFDGEAAVYLLLIDEDGKLIGSQRLISTDQPCLMSEHFPDLCMAGVPKSADIFEVSRYCLDPDLSPADQDRYKHVLALSILEAGLLLGIESFIYVISPSMIPTISALGFENIPLGLPRGEGHAQIMAMQLKVTPKALARARRGAGLTGPLIRTSVRQFTPAA